jgi:type I restriction enzyme S subunit
VNQHIFKVESSIDHRFHYYAALAFANDLRHRTHGGGIVHVTRDRFDSTPLLLPPMQEQARIVEKLEELLSDLDAGIAALERARANLKRYRAAVLKAAVEGRLTEKWRAAHPDVEPAEKLLERILAERRKKWEEAQLAKYAEKGQSPPKGWKDRYPEPVKPDPSALPVLPEGWCWANLEQLKQWAMYGPRFPSSAYADDGCLVLRTTDFGDDGAIDLQSPPRIALSPEDYRRYKAEAGDLLITRTGSLGTLAVFQGGARAIAGAFLLHYRLGTALATVWYVNYFLRSPNGNRLLLKAGRGVGRPNLNMPAVDAISIPFPPLEEQAQINSAIEVAFSVVARSEGDTRQSILRSASLRQSILKCAFEGKLLPQDPKDEPASELLARIRARREAAAEAGSEIRQRIRRNGVGKSQKLI